MNIWGFPESCKTVVNVKVCKKNILLSDYKDITWNGIIWNDTELHLECTYLIRWFDAYQQKNDSVTWNQEFLLYSLHLKKLDNLSYPDLIPGSPGGVTFKHHCISKKAFQHCTDSHPGAAHLQSYAKEYNIAAKI